MNYVPKEDRENHNVSKENHLTNLAVMLVGFLVLVIVIIFSFSKVAEVFLVRLSPEAEKKLFSPLTPDAIFATKLLKPWAQGQNLLKKLDSAGAYEIYAVCDEQANAFAFPGFRIFVTSGLIDKVQSENGLAFVLAHELGHFRNRDHLRGLGTAVGVIAAGLMLGFDSSAANFSNVSTSLVSRSFGRNQEEQADDYALELVQKAYGGLTGVQEFFADVSKEDGLNGKMPSIFLTHPKTQERLEKVNLKIAQAPVIETQPLDKSGVSCEISEDESQNE
jgi:predicted Zn-dependent protease